MSFAPVVQWVNANQQYLVQAFAELRRELGDESVDTASSNRKPLVPPPAIDVLAQAFGLTDFEREVVLLCAGVELDSALARRCSEISGTPQRMPVTFSLAMSALSDAHWSAVAPASPLRRYRLVEMEPACGVTTVPLRIDERILHYIAGVNQLDQRLENILVRKSVPDRLADAHWDLVTKTIQPISGVMPRDAILHFFGDDADGQESIAALIAARANRQLFVLHLEDMPPAGAEMNQFLDLWTREALLIPALLLLQCGDGSPGAAARRLAERLPAPLMIAGRDPLTLSHSFAQYEANKAGPAGQKRLWQLALGAAAAKMRPIVDEISAHFRLSAGTISTLAAATASADLWDACRAVSRPRLESLAERIAPVAGWDDLVLPALQKQMLRNLAAQARHRMTVYEDWGFAARGRRGLGLSALFCGQSGTGKTYAAEVIANELNVDLYRIDLSTVVSKYIGETEKNLRQVFDAAENGGVLLLFDEADALFGKRSEVKDSHDRYANIEVSYLLQRMESFQGLSILTTNQKDLLDRAFQRRLRFIIDFPFPDAAQREAIWTQIFPSQTPTLDLEPSRLATLNMTGGNIRNIAINAAFLAVDSGGKVTMRHVLQATHLEALKIERPLSPRETAGWVL